MRQSNRQKLKLPEYAANFIEIDLSEYEFSDGPFDIMITCPFYIDNWKLCISELTSYFLENLGENGRLIYVAHNDTVRNNCDLSDIPELGGFGAKFSRGYDSEFAVIDV